MENHIGNAVFKVRQERGLRQEDLATLTGLSTNTLSNIEKGRTNPRVKTVIKIAEGLQVTVDYLWQRSRGFYGFIPTENAGAVYQILEALKEAVLLAEQQLEEISVPVSPFPSSDISTPPAPEPLMPAPVVVEPVLLVGEPVPLTVTEPPVPVALMDPPIPGVESSEVPTMVESSPVILDRIIEPPPSLTSSETTPISPVSS